MWGAPGAHDEGKELLLGIPRSRALWYRAQSQPLFLALWGLHGGHLLGHLLRASLGRFPPLLGLHTLAAPSG